MTADGHRMPPGPALPAAPALRQAWLAVFVLSASLLMIGLDNTILNVALPTLQRSLSATPSQLQWTVDAYLLVFAGLLLAAGNLGDRIGRRRALQAGLVIFGCSGSAAASAWMSSGRPSGTPGSPRQPTTGSARQLTRSHSLNRHQRLGNDPGG
jgi:MFS family permease